jgi:hypothetical protein
VLELHCGLILKNYNVRISAVVKEIGYGFPQPIEENYGIVIQSHIYCIASKVKLSLCLTN